MAGAVRDDAAGAVTYDLDHLAAFSVSATATGAQAVSTALLRLNDMHSTIGVWTIRVRVHINQHRIVVRDTASLKVSMHSHFLFLFYFIF